VRRACDESRARVAGPFEKFSLDPLEDALVKKVNLGVALLEERPLTYRAVGSSNHRCSVGFYWCHPLVLPQFQRVINENGFRLMARRLEADRIPDFERLPVPKASVYIVEAHPQFPVTEAVVTGIHARQSASRILLLAERFEDATAFALLRLGVKGLMTYAEADSALPRAIDTVASGGLWVGRALLSRFVDSALCTVPLRVYATGFEGLTRRERQVLEAVLDNLSNKEIARRLQMSERTAKFHVSNLLVKHGVRRRADLLFCALKSSTPAAAPRRPRDADGASDESGYSAA
jgi:DNA-binding NarL/FixJ family response regulator